MSRQSSLKIHLPSSPLGLNWFRVRGIAMGLPVMAEWDGRTLVIDRYFFPIVEVAMKVESAFAEAGLVEHSESFSEDPYRVAIALTRSLDYLLDVDYRSHWRGAGDSPV
jgi:hypothetical protein